METYLGDVELDSLTSKASLVMIDISSQWCGPCKQLVPILEDIEKSLDSSKVKFVKIDATNGAPKFVMDLGIKMVPALLFYKNGKLMVKENGLKSKQQILDIIEGLTNGKE